MLYETKTSAQLFEEPENGEIRGTRNEVSRGKEDAHTEKRSIYGKESE